MDKKLIGKLTTSGKYGSDVQLYHHANGDITYYACYIDPAKLDINNKPLRQRIKIGRDSEGITQAYVKGKRDEFATKARLGEIPEPLKKSRRLEILTLQDLSVKYFTYRAMKRKVSEDHKNIKNDKSVFRNHLDEFAYRNATDIENSEIEEFIRRKEASGAAKSTINNALTLLNSILNYGVSDGLIIKKPKITKLSGIDNERQRFFTTDEIFLIFEHLKDNPILLLFVRISLYTGGRLETVRAIKMKDINLQANTISLVDFKRKSSEKTNVRYSGYFPNSIKSELTTLKNNKTPDTFLFSDPTGAQISQNYIQKTLQSLFNKLFNSQLDKSDRINRAVVHTLRHTFASHLAMNGTDMHKIQTMMNHSNASMTRRYTKLCPSFGLEEINKFNH